LLEITYNKKAMRFWNFYSGAQGGEGTIYSYHLVDYYKDYDEILLHRRHWEWSVYGIYSLRQEGKVVCEFTDSGKPEFNKSRNAVFAISRSIYGGHHYLKIFLIKNGAYTPVKIKNAVVSDYDGGLVVGDWIMDRDGRYEWARAWTEIKDAQWVNDNELQITYTAAEDKGKEIFTLLIKRKDADSEFEIARNK
jgi:hypothetical protein